MDITVIKGNPTDDELTERGPFAQDDIELRGGPGVAPNIIAALRYGLEQPLDEAEFE